MRRYNVNFSAGPRNAVNFSHSAQDVRLVLKEMGEVNAVGAILKEGPRKTRQINQNIRRRAGLPINANSARLLLSFAAAQVEDQHGK